MTLSPLASILLVAAAVALPLGCAGPSGLPPRGFPAADLPIELERFMGDWFVVAHIPTSVEAEAYEAVERYTLRDDGEIDVAFRFCEGALDGPARELTMRGWVHDHATNAEWRIRPFWPLRLRYQILELDPEFSITVVGHPSGRYAWIMARQRQIPEDRIAAIVGRLADMGYTTESLRRVPHADGACLEGNMK